MDRLELEIALVRTQFPQAQLGSAGDHLLVPDLPLPDGWNRPKTRVMILIPPGYPQTPPDCFYADADLRLATGADPGNAGIQTQLGQHWLWFSYHIDASDWRPGVDPRTGSTLLTFLLGVVRRLQEAS